MKHVLENATDPRDLRTIGNRETALNCHTVGVEGLFAGTREKKDSLRDLVAALETLDVRTMEALRVHKIGRLEFLGKTLTPILPTTSPSHVITFLGGSPDSNLMSFPSVHALNHVLRIDPPNAPARN